MLRRLKMYEFIKDKFGRNILIVEEDDDVLNFYSVKYCFELGFLKDNVLYLNRKCRYSYKRQMDYLKKNYNYDFVEDYLSID